MIWIDMMAIPADAPHPGNALKFIDYILRPEVAAEDQRRGRLRQSQSAATKLVDPKLANDPNIYPPPRCRARLFFDKPVTPEYQRLRTRAWTRIKTGE